MLFDPKGSRGNAGRTACKWLRTDGTIYSDDERLAGGSRTIRNAGMLQGDDSAG